jgi:uncharacterized membrane protein YeaQ/YmgE (transglycosylase-associated protein family)
MPLYWTIRAFPELAHLRERERHHLLRTCAGPGVHYGLFLRSVLWGAFGAVISIPCLHFLTDLFSAAIHTIFVAVTGAIVTLLAYQWSMRIIRADLRFELIEAFRGERLPVCLRCGYNLTGIHGDECPECGGGIRVKPFESSAPAIGDVSDDDAAE